jgi:hypothetical protein
MPIYANPIHTQEKLHATDKEELFLFRVTDERMKGSRHTENK